MLDADDDAYRTNSGKCSFDREQKYRKTFVNKQATYFSDDTG